MQRDIILKYYEVIINVCRSVAHKLCIISACSNNSIDKLIKWLSEDWVELNCIADACGRDRDEVSLFIHGVLRLCPFCVSYEWTGRFHFGWVLLDQ